MFEYTDYNIAPWGWELAVYFFLVGTAAMVFVLSAAPNTVGGKLSVFQPVQKPGAVLSLLILVVSAILLIWDLGQPGRFLYPLIYFHAGSPVSWGTVLLVLFGLSILWFAYGLYSEKTGLLRPVGILGSLLALTMPLYTGWDLMAQQARELWHSPSIPVLFVILSASSGAALMALIMQLAGKMNEQTTGLLRTILLFSVSATLVLFVAESLRMLYGSAEEQQAWELINSEYALRYWLLTLIVGIIAPLGLLLSRALARSSVLVTVAGVLGAVGAYTFREVILYAGQLPMMSY